MTKLFLFIGYLKTGGGGGEGVQMNKLNPLWIRQWARLSLPQQLTRKYTKNQSAEQGPTPTHTMKATTNNELERAVDGTPSQIPTLKFLTPPEPQVPPRGMTLATEW